MLIHVFYWLRYSLCHHDIFLNPITSFGLYLESFSPSFLYPCLSVIRWMTSGHSALEPSGHSASELFGLQTFLGSCLVMLFILQPRWELTGPSERPAWSHLNTSSELGFGTCGIFVTAIFQSQIGAYQSSMIMSLCASKSCIWNKVWQLMAKKGSSVRSHCLSSLLGSIALQARPRGRFQSWVYHSQRDPTSSWIIGVTHGVPNLVGFLTSLPRTMGFYFLLAGIWNLYCR